MITIAHVLIGGVLGVATQDPLAALVVGTASHFAMDMVPHLDVSPDAERNNDGDVVWNKALYMQAYGDVLIAAAIVLAIWIARFDFPMLTPFALGAFGGFLPDLIDNVPFWNKLFRRSWFGHRFHAFHEWTHGTWSRRFPMERYAVLGVVTQLVAIGLSLWYLL